MGWDRTEWDGIGQNIGHNEMGWDRTSTADQDKTQDRMEQAMIGQEMT